MLKKTLFVLSVLFNLFLFLSCENMTIAGKETLSFSLGEAAVKEITRMAAPVVTEDSLITVSCQILGDNHSAVTKYEVGDIVYTDGSVSKTKIDALTPVAVIFRAKKTSADGKTLPALGVGLKQSDNKLAWAKMDTTGYIKNFIDIICTPSQSGGGAADTATFEGDVDGSNNWSVICNVDKKGTDTSELIATNYPAFDWVNKYGTANNLQGDYALDWYMPSIAELSELYKNKGTVNDVFTAIGGTVLGSNYYWSSSQVDSYGQHVWLLNFSDGKVYNNGKNLNEYSFVRCIRAF